MQEVKESYPLSLGGFARKRKTLGFSVKRRTRVRRVYGPFNVYGPRNRLPRVPFHLGGQPFRQYARMRYTESFDVGALAAATPFVKSFYANGMYDPRVAAGGHQPYGFDQMMDKYQHYTVLKCTAVLEPAQNTHQANATCMLAVHTNANDITVVHNSGGANALREMPYHSAYLMPNQISQSQRRAYVVADIAKLAGKQSSYELIGEQRYQGDAGANPPEDYYISVVVYNPLDAEVAAPLGVGVLMITLTYFACFTEPKFIPSS